jgi:hypothetical protein
VTAKGQAMSDNYASIAPKGTALLQYSVEKTEAMKEAEEMMRNDERRRKRNDD